MYLFELIIVNYLDSLVEIFFVMCALSSNVRKLRRSLFNFSSARKMLEVFELHLSIAFIEMWNIFRRGKIGNLLRAFLCTKMRAEGS